MIFVSDTKLFAVAGIVYAVAGAALLCQVIFATYPLRANSDAARDLRSEARQIEHRMDARLGGLLLLMGFVLQLIGTLGTAALNGPAALLLIALAFVLIVYAMLKSTLVESFRVLPVEDKTAAPAPAIQIENLIELRPAKTAETNA